MAKTRCVACLKDIPNPEEIKITKIEWFRLYKEQLVGLFVKLKLEITLEVPTSLSSTAVNLKEHICHACIASWLLRDKEHLED